MTDYDIDPVKYGVLWQRVQDYERRFDHMERKMDKMDAQLDELIALANKGKGGLWFGMTVISAISGIVGYVSSYLHK